MAQRAKRRAVRAKSKRSATRKKAQRIEIAPKFMPMVPKRGIEPLRAAAH